MSQTSLLSSLLFASFLCLLLLSCSDNESVSSNGPAYDIVLVDSFQVDYQAAIHVSAFRESNGIFYNFREGSFTLFDTKGTVLRKKYFPSDGANALGYVSGMKIKSDGSILFQTLQGEIGVLDDSLELVEKVIFPFPSVTPNLRSNIKSLDITGDDVLVYYPGRNGKNPLEKGYFKNSKLLEKINITTGELSSVLTLSPDSKFNQDLYFEEPYLHVSIWGDRLYIAFDNEPLIYKYDLNNLDALPITIPIHASKFIEVSGQPIPLGNVEGVIPGLIEGIFPFETGFAVAYSEGLEKTAVDKLSNLNPNYVKSAQKNLLKIYHDKKGWSKETPLPQNVAAILGFENPSEDFYALRNEGLFEGKSDEITVFRYRLTEIE